MSEEVKKLVEELRAHPHVRERECVGNVSSFSFSNKVFFDGLWDETTVKARGLFINTKLNQIVARSYDKFFNAGEKESIEEYAARATYPVRAYVKENGFLGIIGYDPESDELLICSKSTTDGPFAEMFKDILYVRKDIDYDVESIKRFVKENNCSLVCEVNDPENDPHMIEYAYPHIVLLDIIYNEPHLNFYGGMEYRQDFLINTSYKLNMYHKFMAGKFSNAEELIDWYKNATRSQRYQYKMSDIEGLVLCDSANNMVKVKLRYYLFWKYMRSCKNKIVNRIKKEKEIPYMDLDDDGQSFISWFMTLDMDAMEKDIITLRNLYETRDIKNVNES